MTADPAVEAIGTDQRGTIETAPVRAGDAHAVAATVFELHRGGVDRQFYARRAAAGFQQDVMDVGPVDHDVGVIEPAVEFLRLQRHLRQGLAAFRIRHDQGERKVRGGLDRLRNPQPVECLEHIRPELDAIADGGYLRRLLQDVYPAPLLAECQGKAQATQTTTHHDDGKIHICLLVFM
ncbi:hypothetical protein D3C85_1390860 [compost metagenome]